MAGIAAVLGPGGVPVAVGAGVAQVVGFVGVGIADLLKTAPQRRDLDVQPLPCTTPVIFTPLGTSTGSTAGDRLAGHVNDSLRAAGSLITDLRLTDLGLRKFYGAVSLGNTAAAERQRDYACSCVRNVSADFQSYHDALLAISVDVSGNQIGAAATTLNDVIAQRDTIVRTGQFPSSESVVLDEAHVTDDERGHALAEVASVTGDTLKGTDLSVAAVFARAAAAVDHAQIDQFLPNGFVCPQNRRRAVLH